MSRVQSDIAVDTVRLWVSSSEPSRRSTLERFADRFHVPADRMVSCYAMAENIFAVSLRQGIVGRTIGAVEVVSCGAPIAGVQIAIRDGEVLVKSAYAVDHYLNSDSIRETDGFYATGDLGEIIDGELYITGRKADLLNQSGQKFLLNDIDMIVNQALPWVRGRVAATAIRDEGGMIEGCRIFIESGRFFDPIHHQQVAETLRAVLPISHFEVVLTPATLVVKTSSGKVNRKETAARWRAMAKTEGAGVERARSSLADVLPGIDLDAPLAESVDSLGLLIIEMALGGITLSEDERRLPIRVLEAKYGQPPAAKAADVQGAADIAGEEYRVVVLSDPAIRILRLDAADLAQLEERTGRPVRVDYVCMPPARIILQYLTFLDWFACDLPAEMTAPLRHSLDLLRAASIIVADDQTDMAHPYCAYPLLDFGLQRGPLADLLIYRYQRVAQNNHLLPISDVLLGREIPLQDRGADLRNLADYLNVPILRVALDQEFAPYTRDWEHHTAYSRDHNEPDDEVGRRKSAFVEALGHSLGTEGVARAADGSPGGVRASDQTHYCCFVMTPSLLELALRNGNRFIVFGPEVNFQHILREAARCGKTATRVVSLDASGKLPLDTTGYDYIIQAGPWYSIDTDLPVVRLMHGLPPDFQNLGVLGITDDIMQRMRAAPETTSYEFASVYVCYSEPLNQLRRTLAGT